MNNISNVKLIITLIHIDSNRLETETIKLLKQMKQLKLLNVIEKVKRILEPESNSSEPNKGGGYLPGIIELELEAEEEDEDLQNDEGEVSKPETKILEAVALHDYVPDDPKILSLTANERLTLYSKANSDWWTGCKISEEGDKVEGLIADNHIRILDTKGSQDANDEGAGVCRRQVSFKPNLKKWEEQNPKVDERAPDLLKDVLEKSKEIEVSEIEDQEQDAFGTEV